MRRLEQELEKHIQEKIKIAAQMDAEFDVHLTKAPLLSKATTGGALSYACIY